MSYEANTDLEVSGAPSGQPPTTFGRLIDGLNAIGSVVIAAVMLLMCADVARRNLFNQPIDGVAERERIPTPVPSRPLRSRQARTRSMNTASSLTSREP